MQKMRDNIEAIRTAFALNVERRPPNDAEWDILSKYAGFGGLKCILLDANELADVAKWTKSDRELFAPTVELRRIIHDYSKDDREFKRYMNSLQASVLTAYYTPKHVVEAISQTLQQSGVEPQRFLDPSAGSGSFVDAFTWVNPHGERIAFEKDALTGLILSKLYLQTDVHIEGFEKIATDYQDYFDVAASNIPFGDISVADPVYATSDNIAYKKSVSAIHNYFFLKGLDAVREGGIVAFITSQGVMNGKSPFVRMELMKRADLVTALRLPNNTFTDSANTEVGSDLIILQKRSGKTGFTPDEELFMQSTAAQGSGIPNNRYFIENPTHIICTGVKEDTDPYGKPALVYTHDGGVEAIGDDMRRVLYAEFGRHLNIDLYNGKPKKAHAVSTPIYNKVSEKPTPKEKTQPDIEDVEAVEVKHTELKPEQVKAQTPQEISQRADEIETSGNVVPENNPNDYDPKLMMYNLFGELVEIPGAKKRRNKRQGLPKEQKQPQKAQPKSVESKVNTTSPQVATVKAETPVSETPKSGFRPLSKEELELYGSLNWDDNPPINGFYTTMMEIAHRQLMEQEAERQRLEKMNNPDIPDTPYIEMTEGDFIPGVPTGVKNAPLSRLTI